MKTVRLRIFPDLSLFGLLTAAVVLAASSAAQAQVSAVLSAKASDAAKLAGIADSNGHVPVIVEFAPPVPYSEVKPTAESLAVVKPAVAAMQDAIIGTHFGSASDPRPGRNFVRAMQRFDVSPMFAVNVSRQELDALAADPRVVRIHENELNYPTLAQSVPLIGMTGGSGAYALGATGAGQAVAVVDTGVQSNHEFLTGKVVAEACFSNGGAGGVSLCPNGSTTQTGAGAANPETAQCVSGSENICDHGTHVAGIAAGKNTSQGGSEPPNGVALEAKIVAVQVFTRFNSSSSCGSNPVPCVSAYTSDIIAALNWIFQNTLNLPGSVKLASVNMSLGGSTSNANACDSDSRKGIIDSLLGAGVATAIASGNNGFTNGVSAPGCISTAVTVGSSTKADAISSFSNMGSLVDLMAPGSSIQSSIPVVPSSTTTYAFFNGTSMATPHVAGTFAAMRTACPSATVAQMLTALQNTGLSISDTRSGGTFTRPRIRVNLALQQLGCAGGSTHAAHDFNGDNKSDILWRQNTGDVAMWLMNGAAVSSSIGIAIISNVWSIVGQRDFNGDGRADILWRQNTGDLAIWFMNGGAVVSSLGVVIVNPAWVVAGTGDMNADGKGDIVWRNTSSGDTAVWLMNGNAVTASAGLGAIATAWTIAGHADFNGDGRADILWRHSIGALAIWFMNGVSISSSVSLGSVPPAWTVTATGDVNGDGKADIIWRDTSGNVAIWTMNGASVSSSVGLGLISNAWAIVETGDQNGDGKADIVWRSTAGDIAFWFMNGTSVSSSVGISGVPPVWTIQNANAN